MIVNEDGGITGSVDVSKLDEVDAKTDEAKAQLEALKADHERAVEVPQDTRDPQGKSVAAPEEPPVQADPKQAEPKQADEKPADEKPAARKSSGSTGKE